MAFDKIWPEPYPPEGGYIRDGNDQIRDGWYALRERLAVDHKFVRDEDGESNIGCHKKATFLVQSSDPTAVADAGILYTKDVEDKAELFWEDEDANVLQLTSEGAMYGALVPAGIIGMWSGLIDDIPDGWSLCDGDGSTPNLTEKMIRCVASGTDPGGTGGADTHSHADTLAAPAHTHAGTTSTKTAVDPASGDAGPFVGTHNHTFTTGAASATALTGSVTDGSTLPAYYALAFVMKD